MSVDDLKNLAIQYGNIFDRAPQAQLIYHGERVVYANRRAMEILGPETTSAMIGNSIVDFVHPHDQPQERERLAKLEAGVPSTGLMSLRLVRVDGQIMDLEGASLGGLGPNADVVQFVFVEADSEHLADRRASELAAMLDESLNEMYLFDIETLYFLRANRGARENLGYSMHELYELTPVDIKPEFTREEFERVIEPLRTGEKERIAFTTLHSRKDGSTYPVDVFLQTTLFNSKPAFVAMILDVTEARNASDQREKLVAELEQRNAEMERFTYTVSHDLKSPLITIRGFVDFLEKDLEEGNQVRMREDMAEIRDAASKMERLLEDLLALSRIGRVVNPPAPVSLDEIVREAVALLAGPLAQRNGEVVIEPGLPIVQGDRQRLFEVVQNLVENAIKFSRDETRPVIRVSSSADEFTTTLRVRDNGVGIEPEHHERIFGLFERLDSDAEGTGVGLPLVERIVEAHGGRIWVESEGKGHGACFVVSLPHEGITP